MEQLSITQFADIAAQAASSGRGGALFNWLCDVAHQVLAIAVRARGWQCKVGDHWLTLLLPDSTCSLLAKTYNQALRVPLPDDVCTEIANVSNMPGNSDCVLVAARTLAHAALAMSGKKSSYSPQEATADLLGALKAIAQEYETSSPGSPPFPAQGEGARKMDSWIIGPKPAFPYVGKEVSRAFMHCIQLAEHRFGAAIMNRFVAQARKPPEERIFLEEYGIFDICKTVRLPPELITSEILFKYILPSLVEVYSDGQMKFMHPPQKEALQTWFGEQKLNQGCFVPRLEELRRRQPDHAQLKDLQVAAADLFARNLVHGEGPFGRLEFEDLVPSIMRIDGNRICFGGHFGQDEYSERLERPIRNVLAIEPGIAAKHTIDQQLTLHSTPSVFQYHTNSQNTFIANFLMYYWVLRVSQVCPEKLKQWMEHQIFRSFEGQFADMTDKMIAANRYSYDLVVYASYQFAKLDATASKEVLANAYRLLRLGGALLLGFPLATPPSHVSMTDLLGMALAAGFPKSGFRMHIGTSNLSNPDLPGYVVIFKQ